MEPAKGPSKRIAVFSQAKRASLSRWSKEDELSQFGGHHGHRHSAMNFDYDFPIDKWLERRIAVEKKHLGLERASSSFNTKLSPRWKNTGQTSKAPRKQVSGNAGVNPLLTLCRLVNHCEAISDFEEFKGRSLIAALMSRPTKEASRHLRIVKNEEAESGVAATHEESTSTERNAADDAYKSQTDRTSSSTLQRKMSSADPETPPMDPDHPRTRCSGNQLPSASLGRAPSFYENHLEKSDSLEHLKSDCNHSGSVISVSHSFNEADSKFHTSECKLASKQQKLELPKPVRFYYTRLNAAVQNRLNQLTQQGPISSLIPKGPVCPPLPLSVPVAKPHQHSKGLVEPSPRHSILGSGEVTSSVHPCLTSMPRAVNGYHATDAQSSRSLIKPMTKQSVLAALTRVRFQAEGLDTVDTSVLPSSRLAARRPCYEQREASTELEARGQTCVIHDTSSVSGEAACNTQLFHIGDLLQAMGSNWKRETSVSRYLSSSDVI